MRDRARSVKEQWPTLKNGKTVSGGLRPKDDTRVGYSFEYVGTPLGDRFHFGPFKKRYPAPPAPCCSWPGPPGRAKETRASRGGQLQGRWTRAGRSGPRVAPEDLKRESASHSLRRTTRR